MLFRRRIPESRWERFSALLWPRRSFRRSYRYFVKRVIRLDAAPHAVAAGFAAGVFASFTPFIGFHFLLAFAIAYVIAGNMAAAALGTAVGNPATFPFIWGATYEIGRTLTARSIDAAPHPATLESALSPSNLLAIWDPIVKPMLIGSIPLGLAAAIAGYVLVRSAVGSFQAHRRRQIAATGRPPGQPAAPAGRPIVERLAGQGQSGGGDTAGGVRPQPDKV
ncbi:DUF2062 domain-containing protein [Aurantimonas sp. 22II-16-19i]|uniref:DUF2062 domain-containing protein n=1 Tax=Aurantimonas sp. 22II-16-19i TaxID=1317114 RepID=UPI0009F7C1FD|nr:DUF2062 domain-containing protein [Aurantimonas sp. 22II-16-19i]ORE98617.1 hypothetical protein ATO4_03855 [Aurantimonas sp. 22II-16-19i]